MDGQLSPDDVVGPKPTVGVMLRRGMRKRCPRCSGGGLFTGWFRMRARCPRCGFQFERESGFFVGAYLINFAVTEGILFMVVMAFVFVKNAHSEASVVPPLIVGGLVAIVAPVIFYPYSRTIWSAIDLAMSPMELEEIIAAQDALGAPAERCLDRGDPEL